MPSHLVTRCDFRWSDLSSVLFLITSCVFPSGSLSLTLNFLSPVPLILPLTLPFLSLSLLLPLSLSHFRSLTFTLTFC